MPAAEKFEIKNGNDARISYKSYRHSEEENAWWEALNENKAKIKVYINGVEKTFVDNTFRLKDNNYVLGRTDQSYILAFKPLKKDDIIKVECPGYEDLVLKYDGSKLVQGESTEQPGEEMPTADSFNIKINFYKDGEISEKQGPSKWWEELQKSVQAKTAVVSVNGVAQENYPSKFVSKGKYYFNGQILAIYAPKANDTIKIEVPGYEAMEMKYDGSKLVSAK